MGKGVGIDLGTTYSLIGWVKDGKPQVFQHQADDHTPADGRMPSMVFFPDRLADGEEPTVGWAALKRARSEKGTLLFSTKRFMGRGSDSVKADPMAARYELFDDAEERIIRFTVPDGDGGALGVTPTEVAAYVLREFKERVQKETGEAPRDVVITVPAYFDEAQRHATRAAGQLAGLNVLRLLAEPTAAAVAYGLDEEAENRGKGIYVVFDLGGGTFDVSILKFDRGLFRVLATSGNTNLGGDDFDAPIAKMMLESVGLDPKDVSVKKIQSAMIASRELKEKLTDHFEASIEINLGKEPSTFSLDRQTFETKITDVLAMVDEPCAVALKDAQISLDAIDGVVLVGGSTRVPAVRQKVKELFRQEPRLDAHPDEVVVMGAILQADLLTGGEQDMLLLDVTPLSLGVETMGGVIDKLIPRNTTIPVSATHTFTTYADNQTAMDIHVLQGEREMVTDCRSLAQFKLRGIPPLAAGLARIEVNFTLDADGLLTVTAKETSTGVAQSVEVKPSYGLSDEEVEKMLMASIDHAKEDMEMRMLIDARVEGRRLLQIVEGALDEHPDLLEQNEIQEIHQSVLQLEEAMKGDDRHELVRATEALELVTKTFAERRMDESVGKALSQRSLEDFENQGKNV